MDSDFFSQIDQEHYSDIKSELDYNQALSSYSNVPSLDYMYNLNSSDKHLPVSNPVGTGTEIYDMCPQNAAYKWIGLSYELTSSYNFYQNNSLDLGFQMPDFWNMYTLDFQNPSPLHNWQQYLYNQQHDQVQNIFDPILSQYNYSNLLMEQTVIEKFLAQSNTFQVIEPTSYDLLSEPNARQSNPAIGNLYLQKTYYYQEINVGTVTQFKKKKEKRKSSLATRRQDPEKEIYNPPKFEGDRYTPCYIRSCRKEKQGMCRECFKEGKMVWMKLKHSGYWYHMNNIHGIGSDGLAFKEPIKKRCIGKIDCDNKNKKNLDEKIEIIQGLCHKCDQWIDLVKYPSKSKIPNILWKKHAQKCHSK